MNFRTSFLAISLLSSVVLASASASAQTIKVAAADPPPPSSDVSAEIGIYGYGSAINIDNLLHAIDSAMPDPLKNKRLRMTGTGAMPGGEIRIGVMPRLDPYGRLRFGLDIGMGGLTGLGVATLPLAEAVSYKAGSAWGAHFDGYIGREFAIGRREDVIASGRHAWLYPYIDVRAGLTVTQAKLDLSVAKLGFVGSTTFDAYSFDIGPRGGFAIPLGQNVSFDLGAYGNVYGVERWGAYAGFSVVAP